MQVRPDDPKLRGHPMLLRRGWQRRAIPIVVHGDGGRFTNNNKNSLMVVSWRPLLNPRFGIGTFLLWCLAKTVRASGTKHGIDSHHELWLLTVFLVNALYTGRYPETDHKGDLWPTGSEEAQRFASQERMFGGDLFLVVWSLTGDLPYLAEECGLPPLQQ